MQKTILWLIVLTVISILLIINAAALDVSLNAPSEAEIGEEFSVEIHADSTDNYDVKLFVHDSEDEKIAREEYISEIYDEKDNSWKDPWFYLNEFFPEYTSYDLKVKSSPGQRELCVRLRKSTNKDGGFEQTCTPISITGEEKDEDEEHNDANKETQDKEEQREIVQTTIIEEVKKPIEEISFPKPAEQKPEKITLNTKTQASEKLEQKITTSEGKKKNFLMYGLMALCVFLVILIALRKL